ncbi:MAG: hypothetical protein UT05_C0010G0023 [Parcubacteria group bacterium GW2011_GWF2_38_76]|nr:MAG: hypothetical protein UT05_C0010G0023 [Parcubacteria group bacterium GW2011_GWF2_38_76]HBM45546.1 hypothetical protein [Patescibacteria group bacterium]
MKKNYNRGNTGPLVASIIIVIVLLVGAFYALKERPLKTETNEPTVDDIQLLETQSTSTEITDIEADLNATNLDDLGLDLDSAEAEL